MNKPTETTASVELDANAQYLVFVNDFIAANKNILGSQHPMGSELANKLLQSHGLALRQVKRLAKIIKDK